MTPAEPRIEREIAALTAWIAFDDAAAGRKGLVADDEVEDGKRSTGRSCARARSRSL